MSSRPRGVEVKSTWPGLGGAKAARIAHRTASRCVALPSRRGTSTPLTLPMGVSTNALVQSVPAPKLYIYEASRDDVYYGHFHDFCFIFIIHLRHIYDVGKTSMMYSKCKINVMEVAKIDIISRCLSDK